VALVCPSASAGPHLPLDSSLVALEFRQRLTRVACSWPPLWDPAPLIIGSVSAAAYAVGTIGGQVMGEQLSGTVWRRRMQQEIDHLEGYSIVRGWGRVGRQVVEHLQLPRTSVVVVEPADAAYEEGEAEPPRIRGDATDDRALSLADEITRQGRLRRCGRRVE